MTSNCCGSRKHKIEHSSPNCVKRNRAVNVNTSNSSSSSSSSTSSSSSFNTKMINVPEMCYFCFDVLYSHLHGLEPPRAPRFTTQSYPLFVTWEIGKNRRLRGCIGSFNSLNLQSGLREYAITSAMNDSRFSPITKDEFSRLTVTVSILTDFEEALSYRDWDIGVHGVRIEFYNERGNRRTSTYLPKIALEQGWDHMKTIDSLLRKGGYKSQISEEFRRKVKVTRYQSQVMSMNYNEYVQFANNIRG